MPERDSTYLHVDMDAFFASVEQVDHPELKGRPVVVGSPPDQRGVVSAASYEARRFGIHSAMPSRIAYRKCPEAVFLPVNMKRYRAISRTIMQIFESYTPMIQPLSIDEAFLDVSGALRLFGDARSIAEKIRGDIRTRTGLTCSVGIAPNMFLAKIASDLNKPDGLTEVPFDQQGIEAFLAPLPVHRMWGVGKVTQKKLLSLGLTTIGDLQVCSPARLEQALGKHAAGMFLRLARGIDARHIEAARAVKSISNETTFEADVTDPAAIESAFMQLVDKVARQLRAEGLHASTLHIKLRWSDFSTMVRQTRLERPCCDDITLRQQGLQLLRQHLRNRPVRLLGFGLSGFDATGNPPQTQLPLFEEPDSALYEKRKRLSEAADDIREKFGHGSLKRGSDLK